MNTYSLYKPCLFPLLFLLLLSCSAPPSEPGDDVGGRSYEFSIEREESEKNQTFSGVKAKWNHDIGTIVLGPEDEGEPLALLMISIDMSGNVISATLSTTDVRVGTGDELNGKLYQLTDLLVGMRIKGNTPTYIQVDGFEFSMDRQIMNQNDVPESIVVTGSFTAYD